LLFKDSNATVRYITKELFLGKMEQFSKHSSKKEKFKTMLLLLLQIKAFMKELLKTIKPMVKGELSVKMDPIMKENG
jgi:hypothetical protein